MLFFILTENLLSEQYEYLCQIIQMKVVDFIAQLIRLLAVLSNAIHS